MLLPEGPRPRRSPAAAVSAAPALTKAAVFLCALLIPVAAPASGGGGYDDYQKGDYQAAFDEYNRLAAANTNDYRLHYNAGTSAYSAKDLEAAEKQLGAALNSPEIVSDLPAQEHAYYNLGNTLYHLGEPDTDPKKNRSAGNRPSPTTPAPSTSTPTTWTRKTTSPMSNRNWKN